MIIPTLDAARYLGRALAPLLEGATSGFVREVIIADGGSEDSTLEIADDAGCVIVKSAPVRAQQWIAGARAARAPWLLFQRADVALDTGWLEATRAFVRQPSEHMRAAVFGAGISATSHGLFARWRACLASPRSAEKALLISRKLYDAVGGHRDLAANAQADLMARIGAGRLARLRAKALQLEA